MFKELRKKMFTDIGKKIKWTAKYWAILGMLVSVAVGMCYIIFNYSEPEPMTRTVLVIIGIEIMIVGAFIAWVVGWAAYGYGELIDSRVEQANTIADTIELIEKYKDKQV